MQGQRDFNVARQVRAWPDRTPRLDALAAQAEDTLTLCAEHTWGASWHAATPSSDETAIQLSHKLEYAYQGATLARYLKRDALLQLAQQLVGRGPSLLIYNPQLFVVTSMLRVPENAETYAPNMAQLAQRFDVEWNGRQGQERWAGPVTLPPLGYVVLPLVDAQPAALTGLVYTAASISNGLVSARFSPERGVASLVVNGREFARDNEPLARLVLERPEPARRDAIFGLPRWLAFDMHDARHVNWTALREYATVEQSQSRTLPGAVEHEQRVAFANGETAAVVYRLHPSEAVLHVLVTLRMNPDVTPRAAYLNLLLRLEATAVTRFETAGATVEFDREQLPGGSRHFVTTLGWLRMQDGKSSVTVATPDAPLWQVGGFTFGPFDGEGRGPYEATLNAWLTNNPWDANFRADQAGELRFKFSMAPQRAENLVTSVQRARGLTARPEVHVFIAGEGDTGLQRQLLNVDLDGVCLTGLTLDPARGALVFQVFNSSDEPRVIRVAAGRFRPTRVTRRSLSGTPGAEADHDGESFRLSLPARLWREVFVEVE